MSDPPDPPPVPIPPAPLPQQISDRWKGVYWAPSTYLRGHLFVHAAAFLAVATSLATQPERYTADRWLGLLFITAWASPQAWAVVFALLAAIKLLAGFLYPALSRPAMVAGAMILVWWIVGFGFAWLEAGATILPVVLAGLDLGEHVAAATMLDGRRYWRPHRSG